MSTQDTGDGLFPLPELPVDPAKCPICRYGAAGWNGGPCKSCVVALEVQDAGLASGTELAEAVAIALGWRLEWREISPIYGVPGNRVCDVWGFNNEPKFGITEDLLPAYLSRLLTWDGAGQILEQMSPALTGMSCQLHCTSAGRWRCEFSTRLPGEGAWGDTGPEAICRAALVALRAMQDGGE